MRTALTLSFVGLVLSTVAAAADLSVTISSPADESFVARRPIVKGSVSDPKAQVWVIVRPFEDSKFWVQPRVSVRDSGKWKVKIYIGQPGSVDVGKIFEIRAVVNPMTPLQEGMVLGDWPKAEAISNLREFTRK